MGVKRLIVVLGLAGFIVMADNWVVSPLLPSIAHTVGVAPARAGVLIAAYMLPFGPPPDYAPPASIWGS
jgi:predicted MFS family arabinose efflux permease